jgi:hypothetical protein
VEKTIGDISIDVSHKCSHFEWNNFRNTFEISVKNKDAKPFKCDYDIYSKEKQTSINEEEFNKVVIKIYEACFVNSWAYDDFEEWCYDWGYDETDEDNREIYEDSIKRGDELNKIISKEWIEMMDTYIVMANIKTT